MIVPHVNVKNLGCLLEVLIMRLFNQTLSIYNNYIYDTPCSSKGENLKIFSSNVRYLCTLIMQQNQISKIDREALNQFLEKSLIEASSLNQVDKTKN